MLPDGFHYATACDFSGHNRPGHVVESDIEVELHWEDAEAAGIKQPVFHCAYCHDRFRTRSLATALNWWHAHDCRTLELAEAKGIVLHLHPLATGGLPSEVAAAA